MEGIIILWLVLAAPFVVWAVSVTDYKGRSQVFGFLLGGLFGPLGVAMAWLLPPNETVIWERRAAWERAHQDTSLPWREAVSEAPPARVP